MKFKVTKVSDCWYDEEIKIKFLSELKDLAYKHNSVRDGIVVYFYADEDGVNGEIRIRDVSWVG